MLPTVYQYRASISLYDSQYDPETGEKIPIPDDIIEAVVSVLSRFVVICDDFGCKKDSVHVIATEATRAAVNSKQFLATIKDKTGLTVELLPKEEEGQIGALGIASGFSNMEGLVMDLGGGSTQITWMLSSGGQVRISPKGSFSFPYGAAALTKKLHDLRQDKKKEEADAAVKAFEQEMISNFKDAYHNLQIPEEMVEKAKKEGGYRIYLSGGGFRGWGYLLLYLNQTDGSYYPISIINASSSKIPRLSSMSLMLPRTSSASLIADDLRSRPLPSLSTSSPSPFLEVSEKPTSVRVVCERVSCSDSCHHPSELFHPWKWPPAILRQARDI